MDNQINSLDLAGHHVTDYLESLMVERGYNFSGNKDRQNLSLIKEKFCQIR